MRLGSGPSVLVGGLTADRKALWPPVSGRMPYRVGAWPFLDPGYISARQANAPSEHLSLNWCHIRIILCVSRLKTPLWCLGIQAPSASPRWRGRFRLDPWTQIMAELHVGKYLHFSTDVPIQAFLNPIFLALFRKLYNNWIIIIETP